MTDLTLLDIRQNPAAAAKENARLRKLLAARDKEAKKK